MQLYITNLINQSARLFLRLSNFFSLIMPGFRDEACIYEKFISNLISRCSVPLQFPEI